MVTKKLLSLPEAEAALQDALKSFGEDAKRYLTGDDRAVSTPPLLAIRATAGLGKTHGVIKDLLSYNLMEHGDVHYFVPNHKLSKQLEDDLNEELTLDLPNHDAQLQRARIIAGRSQIGENGQPLCQKYQLANRLAATGHSVYPTLCRNDKGKCEFFEGCAYLEQMEDISSPITGEMAAILNEVKVMTHEHMFLPTKDRFIEPALVVIDEGFVTKAFDSVTVLLEEVIRFLRPESGLFQVCTMIDKGEPEILRRARELTSPERLLSDLEEALIDENARQPVLDIRAPTASQEASLGLLQGHNVPLLIQTLADEMRLTNRDVSHAIRPSKGGVVVLRRKSLKLPSVPVLIIDADANKELLELYFGRKVEVIDIPVERLAVIHQFKDKTFSKRALLEAESTLLDDVKDFVSKVSASGNTLVVATKEVRRALSGEAEQNLTDDVWFEGATLTHFNSLRGVNRYADYQNIVIIGREQPSTTGLEDLARALWWDADKQLLELADQSGSKPLMKSKGTYWVQDGATSAQTYVHPDERANALLGLIREAESVQAIDRLRLLRPHREGLDRRVFILSSQPLDLRLDHLWSWDSLKESQRIIDACGGIVPFNPKHLLKLDPVVRGIKTAERRIRDLKALKPLINILISEVRVFVVEYKTASQRVRSKALIVGDYSLRAVRARLKALANADVSLELCE